jgi:hypothetical protein
MTMKYIQNCEKCTEFSEISQSKCRRIPGNFAEFRVLHQKLPYSAGSQKTTFVDTRVHLWTGVGCALVFASEAKIQIEEKILFRLEAKKA